MTMAFRLAVIGGGNMARAIVRGAIDAGSIEPGGVVVVEPDGAKREEFARWGVASTPSPAGALDRLDTRGGARPIVLLAVKPQMLGAVAAQMRTHFSGNGCLVISILAGVSTGSVGSALGAAAVVRAMPNTAARVRQSITAVAAGGGATAKDLAEAERLLNGLGPTVRIDESLMDAFTSLAGSGPAYVFYLVEAMVRAGVEMGFESELADRVVRQTIAGAAALLRGSEGASPAELRAAVTSKGGTTEAAVGVLTERNVMRTVVEAILKGRDRGRELAAR